MLLIVDVYGAQFIKPDYNFKKNVPILCCLRLKSPLEKKRNTVLKLQIQDPTQEKWDCHFELESIEMSDTIEIKFQEKLKFSKHTLAVSSFNVSILGGEGHSRKTSLSLFPKKKILSRELEPLGSLNLKIELAPSTPTIEPKSRRSDSLLFPTLTDSEKSVRKDSLLSTIKSESLNEGNTQTKTSGEEYSHTDAIFDHSQLSKMFDLESEDYFYGVIRCSYFSPLLIHGRLYISDHHLCFISRFLGRLTREVISLNHLTGISKKISPSNVVVQTRSRSFNFLSFRGLDLYTLLVKAWKREDLDLSLSSESKDVAEETDLELLDGTIDHPLDTTLKEVVSIDFPISVTTFFKKFYGDSFTRLFHETRGCTEISIDPWTKHDTFGMIREISFKYAVKNFPIASTTVNMTQRYTLSKDHLVVLTSVVLRDVPLADSFTIEFKDDVTEISPHKCRSSIGFFINKSKRIVSSSQEAWMEKEAKNFFTSWIALARGELAKEKTSKTLSKQRSLQLSEPSTNTSTSTPNTINTPTVKSPSKSKSIFEKVLSKDFTISLIIILCIFCVLSVVWLLVYISSVEIHAVQLKEQIGQLSALSNPSPVLNLLS